MELRIKEIIKSKGLTMQEFADTLGIARVNLTKTINGNPTIETLQKIANALAVPITDLFEKKLEKGDNEFKCPNCGAELELKKSDNKK